MSEKIRKRPMPKPESLRNLTGGSRKGIPNKVTTTVKEGILLAFDAVKTDDESGQGHEAFAEWANNNKTVFYTQIWAKVMPMQIVGDEEQPLQIVVKVTPQ